MIRPVDFLDHPLAGDPVEHRQEQGILPDKRLHGPDRTLHSLKLPSPAAVAVSTVTVGG